MIAAPHLRWIENWLDQQLYDGATLGSDTQTSPPSLAAVPPARRLLAPWWHTAIFVVVLLLASVNGSRGAHLLSPTSSKLPQYFRGIAWEWILVLFTWLGIRQRISFRELIGGRWSRWEDFFLDVVYAATFWLCALVVLGVGAKLMHLDQAGKIENMRRQLGFLTPRTNLELATWFFLSTTAGFCEEILFRGYLQRQFTAITNSALLGVLLSAFIFGAAHGYEGSSRMILIGIYGLMFGILAWWIKKPSSRDDSSCLARCHQRRVIADVEIASVHACFTHSQNYPATNFAASGNLLPTLLTLPAPFFRRASRFNMLFLLDYFFRALYTTNKLR